MRRIVLILPILVGFFVQGSSLEAKKYEYDRRTKNLATFLGGGEMNPGTKEDVKALGERLKRILAEMKQSDISNGPAAQDLLAAAYEMRQDLCPPLVVASYTNVAKQFEVAEMMGLFNGRGGVNIRIAKGRDIGEDVQFEHIVPVPVCPEFSTSLANIRLVAPSNVRKSDDVHALDARTVEVAKRFRSMVDEQIRFSKFAKTEDAVEARRHGSSEYGMGRTKEEHEHVWKALVDQDPSVLKNKPYMHSEVKKTITRVGYGLNQIAARITNRSQHPTEVTVDFRMIGRDELARKKSIELNRYQETLKILQLQERLVELDGVTEKTYHRKKLVKETRYRGWVLTIWHRGEVVSHTAHPAALLDEYPP